MEPRSKATSPVDVVRLPVVVEQTIGELAFDANGHRSIVGAALVVIADFVNAQTKMKVPHQVPLRFSFPNGEGERFVVTIDTDE